MICNWFTNRRLENKRAGIFPRHKPLEFCSYCKISLTSSEATVNHLFSVNHVKKILKNEFNQGNYFIF